MFDTARKTITLRGKTEPVVTFQVWFTTPFGLMEDIDEAAKRCAAANLEPALNVRPVPVAVSETLYEVIGG